MKLYISDLDGTLLSDGDNLSIDTVNILRNCIKKGIKFTFATGRSLFYAKKFIEELQIKLPVVLSNGVYIYDPISKDYLMKNYLDKKVSGSILELLESNDVRPFINITGLDGDEKIYHKDISEECMKQVFE